MKPRPLSGYSSAWGLGSPRPRTSGSVPSLPATSSFPGNPAGLVGGRLKKHKIGEGVGRGDGRPWRAGALRVLVVGAWNLGVIVQRPHSHRTWSSRVWCLWTTCPAISRAAEQEKFLLWSLALTFSFIWALGPRGSAETPLFRVTTAPSRVTHSTVTVVHSEASGGLRVRVGGGKPGSETHSEPHPWH